MSYEYSYNLHVYKKVFIYRIFTLNVDLKYYYFISNLLNKLILFIYLVHGMDLLIVFRSYLFLLFFAVLFYFQFNFFFDTNSLYFVVQVHILYENNSLCCIKYTFFNFCRDTRTHWIVLSCFIFYLFNLKFFHFSSYVFMLLLLFLLLFAIFLLFIFEVV